MKLAELAALPPGRIDYPSLRFDYERCADQDAAAPVRHPVVVVGAGPVGLTLAIDLAQRGVPVVLLEGGCTLSSGSRAICFAKRTLEIFDRLGCGDRMVDKGVAWGVGRVFFRDAQVYRFDLLAEEGHERPAFVNLQQYYVEGFLVQRAAELPLIDLRWLHKVVAVEAEADRVVLRVDTPDGPYRLAADHVVACDGSRSTLRERLGLASQGRVFHDRFLIADVKVADPARVLRRPVQRRGAAPAPGAAAPVADGAAAGRAEAPPAERWFWFDPSFHRGQSVLLHMQPDGVWRIDFQLGADADPDEERKPENIVPRVRAVLGSDVAFELCWASVYTFACTRMASFRHGRVLFAGDAAHGVSPFGARGANSGVQDAENLAWKLALVVAGRAPDALLDSYASEREYAADENIRHSTRSTDFITPTSEISRVFRDAVLDLARHHRFARSLVNSGRLSVATTLDGSPLNTPDTARFDARQRPGAAAADAPIAYADGRDGWLLRELGGTFTALVYADDHAAETTRQLVAAAQGIVPLRVLHLQPCGSSLADAAPGSVIDRDGVAAERYDLLPGSVVLVRPDQHVCARWRQPSADAVHAALRRAIALA